MNEIYELLSRHRLRFGTEKDLQDDIHAVFKNAGIESTREYSIGADAIDFLTESGVGVECKVEGGPGPVLEQITCYAGDPAVKEMLLVTSRHTHRFRTKAVYGKRFRVLWIGTEEGAA